MANDLNRICLIGRLGKDAEIADTQAGKQFMKVTLATNRKKGQEEITEWHNIKVWNEKLVENLHPYLTKGKQIYLEGLATSWEKVDDNGLKTTIPFVEVSYGHNIQLLGSKNDSPIQVKTNNAQAIKDEKQEQDDGVPW